MDAVEKIEEYLASVEEYFFSSLSAVTHSVPDVHEAVNRIWVDISRYGPGMPAFPEVHIPTLGDFQVPPPPPPPPPSPSWIGRSAGWVGKHPWKTSGIAIGVVGAGLLVGYTTMTTKRNTYRVRVKSTERRQVVVVLGGDSPFALPLILELEKKEYIVIASVSTPEAVEALESQCSGYVKALVLDPQEPATIPVFLRSLASTLSRKFPITAHGDPYASPSSHPYIQSVISLLTLSSLIQPILAPLEHISLRSSYLPYLNATQITPLQVIQSLLPLLRTGPARSRDKGKKSIIVCLPATDVRVGLPFASMQAMSAAGTLKGIEILRREINAAALTDKTESMRNLKVVTVDVGSFNTATTGSDIPPEGLYKAMENWSASEKVTYGPSFAAILHNTSSEATSSLGTGNRYGIKRRPTNISVFVDNLIGVVSGGRYGPTLFGINIGIGTIRNWIRGERFSVGAGAITYNIASHLPPTLLDVILNIPHFLISIRNRLLPVQPFRQPPKDLPPAQPRAPAPAAAIRPADIARLEAEAEKEAEADDETHDSSSDADVESVTSGEGVEDSWVKA
ncbi:hypothetical protein BDQ12DRAFT_703011 [Crucibulum laeve]|uniref:DUF1776-domain-containing protein n=1 Tax=Crucibulum laeve TaxID=68775 RepID=A0A5C3MAP2_9AGAR|nr:hypothetical protein BDQ12DRAFT_703011 [Crucibulum laeve]